jgi:hypothetical protein
MEYFIKYESFWAFPYGRLLSALFVGQASLLWTPLHGSLSGVEVRYFYPCSEYTNVLLGFKILNLYVLNYHFGHFPPSELTQFSVRCILLKRNDMLGIFTKCK